nr:hypothetical protein JVH1_3828 [Rhodococcus sp. JVH1]
MGLRSAARGGRGLRGLRLREALLITLSAIRGHERRYQDDDPMVKGSLQSGLRAGSPNARSPHKCHLLPEALRSLRAAMWHSFGSSCTPVPHR